MCGIHIGQDLVNPTWKLAFGPRSVEANNILGYNSCASPLQ